MKRPKTLLLLAASAILGGFAAGIAIQHFFCAVAGDLEPSAAPAPTMKTLDEVEPRIPISSVPYSIGLSGSYYLTKDLQSSGTGISVGVDNVTIDLMGFTLEGPGGTDSGIYIGSHTGIEIRNGIITEFYRAIYGSLATKCRAIDLRVINNASTGIYMTGDANLVKDCTVTDNGHTGIWLGDFCQAVGNIVYDNVDTGIYGNWSCTAKDNTCYSNGDDGISLGVGSLVVNNNSYENVDYGIYASTGSQVTGNIVYDNGNDGIYGGAAVVIENNNAYSNTGRGIYASDGSRITGNTVNWSSLEGIETNNKCIISNNTVRSCTHSGIYAGSQCSVIDNLVITNNTANLGYHHGIRVYDNCLVKGNNLYGNNTSNIYVESYYNNVENNTTTGSAKGIWLYQTDNLYVNNRASNNTIDYEDVGGNTDGGGNISY